MRASVYIATSLDGFIARENGDIDWLDAGDASAKDPSEDYGYAAFFRTVDVLVMGRGTYEKVLTFGGWPYGSTPAIVLSSRPLAIPEHLAPSVEASTASPADLVEQLTARGFRHAYVDGGQTIQRFLAAGLIERLIVTRIPILLGAGKPLFGELPSDIRLRHVRTDAFPSGLVQSEYEVLGRS
ncbi:MAG: dihydrofolate reductase family protein [Chloroflexi bacterium]|nr:dihydrofolate reductase family protein [Chloroflexota bacterium]